MPTFIFIRRVPSFIFIRRISSSGFVLRISLSRFILRISLCIFILRITLCTPTQLSINDCSCHSNSQTRESISRVHFIRAMDATLNGGFSCLLQRRLNSRIPLVCQRNVSRRCVHSLVSLVHSLHAPHSIACSSVCDSGQCQRLSDVIKILKNTEILGIVTKRESTRHRDKNSC